MPDEADQGGRNSPTDLANSSNASTYGTCPQSRNGSNSRADQIRRCSRDIDGDRVVLAVQHERRDAAQLGQSVSRRSKSPRLAQTSCWVRPVIAERRQVVGAVGIVEVGRDRELEDPSLEGLRIALAKTALAERAALLLKDRIQIALAEPALEALARRSPGRRRRDEGEALDGVPMLQRVQQREQRAPGVSRDREPVESPQPGAARRDRRRARSSPPARRARPATGPRRAGRSRSARDRRPGHRIRGGDSRGGRRGRRAARPPADRRRCGARRCRRRGR